MKQDFIYVTLPSFWLSCCEKQGIQDILAKRRKKSICNLQIYIFETMHILYMQYYLQDISWLAIISMKISKSCISMLKKIMMAILVKVTLLQISPPTCYKLCITLSKSEHELCDIYMMYQCTTLGKCKQQTMLL